MARTFELRVAGNITAINPLQVKRVEGIGGNKKSRCRVMFDSKDTIIPEESFETVVGQLNDALRY